MLRVVMRILVIFAMSQRLPVPVVILEVIGHLSDPLLLDALESLEISSG
jgi:hypothetical protein